MTRHLRTPLGFVMGCSLWLLWSCVPAATPPEQPLLSKPFAILKFSAAMQLIEVDGEPVESRRAIRTLKSAIATQIRLLRFSNCILPIPRTKRKEQSVAVGPEWNG